MGHMPAPRGVRCDGKELQHGKFQALRRRRRPGRPVRLRIDELVTEDTPEADMPGSDPDMSRADVSARDRSGSSASRRGYTSGPRIITTLRSGAGTDRKSV